MSKETKNEVIRLLNEGRFNVASTVASMTKPENRHKLTPSAVSELFDMLRLLEIALDAAKEHET